MLHNNISNNNDIQPQNTKSVDSNLTPCHSYIINLENDSSFLSSLKRPTEIAFYYIISGHAFFSSENESFSLHAEEGVFFNQNCKYNLLSEKSHDCILYFLAFDPVNLLNNSFSTLADEYFYPLLNHPNCKNIVLKADTPFSNRICQKLRILKTLTEQHSWGYEFDLLSTIFSIMSEFCKHFLSTEQIPSFAITQDDYRIKQAILFIQNHFSEQITLDDIANAISISKSECCRCFKRSLNMRPFEYLLQYRVIESSKLLMGSNNLSISIIATMVGFNNTSYYNKIFKQYYHMTPSEFKKRCVPSHTSNKNQLC